MTGLNRENKLICYLVNVCSLNLCTIRFSIEKNTKKPENKMFTDYEQKVNNLIKENITKFLSPLKMKWGKSESDHLVFSK